MYFSCPRLNMGFVRGTITKMAGKKAAAYQFAFVDTTYVIYYPIASEFYIWITFIKLLPKFEYRLCPITKMATKMAASCRFALVNTLNLVIYHPIYSKFHILTTFIKLSPNIKYGFCLINDNQDGSKNDRLWSVCTCGHSNLVIYHPISSKLHA